jgi:hypothetical protein
MNFEFDLTQKGHLKKRESFDLEYKENFQLGDNLVKYIKTLAGMANSKGGIILFGVKDSPHIPLGMQNNKFTEIDPRKIDKEIREYFSPELIWETYIQIFDNKSFGTLKVKEAESKPVVCKKNKDNILREGAIYYRYRGETKEIEYPELKSILDKEKEKEKLMWMNLVQKIGQIGPQNISILDTYKGEIEVGDQKILIDEKVLHKIKFIKEGQFTEKVGEGLPTLRLIGDVDGVVNPDLTLAPDIVYPLLSNDILKRLPLNQHDFTCICWKLKIKGNKKYHTEIRIGEKSNSTHKYSEGLIYVLDRLLKREDFLSQCRSEYRKSHPVNPRKKRK